jgi:uncharacterized protein (DUF433 family)
MGGRSFGDRIVVTPGGRCGKPRIAGQRITVADVAIWHERMGMSPDEILSKHPTMTLSEVHAALAYYFDHRDELDREIRDDEESAEKLRAGAPSIFEELKTRKASARTIRFHLDENGSHAIAAGMRRRGINVSTTPEVGLLGAIVEDKLANARADTVADQPDPRSWFPRPISRSRCNCVSPH